MLVTGAGLWFAHSWLGWRHSGRGLSDWLIWLAIGLVLLSAAGWALFSQHGPFSTQRNERLVFWKAARQLLIVGGLYFIAFYVGVPLVAALYAAWRFP